MRFEQAVSKVTGAVFGIAVVLFEFESIVVMHYYYGREDKTQHAQNTRRGEQQRREEGVDDDGVIGVTREKDRRLWKILKMMTS